MTCRPSERNTSSNAPEYLASLSRIRNWALARRSLIARLRACVVTQAEQGWAVTPARCTLRVEISIKKST